MPDNLVLRIFRGDQQSGDLVDYQIAAAPGMVVLDAVHRVQATQAPDLAVRWNCKAGKCGSCSAEVNGLPRLLCMDRIARYPAGQPITVRPMQTFPVIKDLACDVSWNYQVNKKIPPFRLRRDRERRFSQAEADRVQEFRKCIECFLRVAALEMHPLDDDDRTGLLKQELGVGFCNITKCCTEVCPEHIAITDNAIIPLKERVADQFYDPLKKMLQRFLSKLLRRSPDQSQA
jgi:succinate dehydrogenase / fumarate reductase, iron-sulfur subunit